ncbi:ribokinase [Rhodobium gokarnense]|uniref:Ribokinase n=1 Tax=Rhodobium gokarnense TaxID=364296 RepID=A0ABT3HDL2_9HYPH|nr:ribokinase [Rhodobium gokarnense]MCW2308493.1 ribokinase [Rhodobium gokarnense]
MAANILVFGSLNADLVFAVDRLPAPGETVIGPGYTVIPGGKGANQAVAAAGARVPVQMAGCVGADSFGDLLLRSLEGARVGTSFVHRIAAPTGCAAIGVDAAGANQIMVAGGANLEARAADVADAMLTPQTTLVLQMEVTAAENWALIRRARDRGTRTVLNVAPAAPLPEEILPLIDVLVVNEGEAVAVARGLDTDRGDPLDCGRFLAGRTGGTCVVTLGEAGSIGFSPEGAWRVGALPVKPVDTTAAGDGFVGWLAARLGFGDALPAAMRWAAVAAGLACETAGAQPSLPGLDAVAGRLSELAEPERV